MTHNDLKNEYLKALAEFPLNLLVYGTGENGAVKALNKLGFDLNPKSLGQLLITDKASLTTIGRKRHISKFALSEWAAGRCEIS